MSLVDAVGICSRQGLVIVRCIYGIYVSTYKLLLTMATLGTVMFPAVPQCDEHGAM